MGVVSALLKFGGIEVSIADSWWVNPMSEVCSLLVALVDSALQYECFSWVYLRITDYILEMPLYSVNPALQVQLMIL